MSTRADKIASAVPEPLRPSSSTTASLVGGALVVIAAYVVEFFLPEPLPGPVVAAATTLATAGVGYFFYGGRSRETI